MFSQVPKGRDVINYDVLEFLAAKSIAALESVICGVCVFSPKFSQTCPEALIKLNTDKKKEIETLNQLNMPVNNDYCKSVSLRK